MKRNWFWGIFFVVAAIFVVASAIGTFGQLNFWTLAATVVLAALLIQSLIMMNYFGIFVPLSFLYMIWYKPLGLIYVNPWVLILAAVLISIGMHIMFRKGPRVRSCCNNGNKGKQEHMSESTETIDDNNPYAKVSFGSSTKYLHGESLKSGQFAVSFGSLEVFFDKAQLDPEGAEIYVDCSFGEMKLFIPKNWKVVEKIKSNLGGVQNDIRIAKPDDNAPALTIKGNVQFGNIEISYI